MHGKVSSCPSCTAGSRSMLLCMDPNFFCFLLDIFTWSFHRGLLLMHVLLIRCRLFRHKRALAATANACLLQKCLKQRMWDNSSQQCRQLPGIGKLLSERLVAAGLGKLRDLEAADPRLIEYLTQRKYPFGAHNCLMLCCQNGIS